MASFWEWLTGFLQFTGIDDQSAWQDVLVSAILLPIFFFAIQRLYIYLDRNRPIKSILKGYIKPNTHLLIFHSQLRAVDESVKFLKNPQYVNIFPAPRASDRSRMEAHFKKNIDPVWSEGDGECLASVYNLLGRAGKTSGIEIADTVRDWSKHSRPIISIGFNPKTHDLQSRCSSIDYVLDLSAASLSIPKTNVSVDAYLPNDGGVVQKTSLKSSGVPVLILAGLGTIGTSAAGFVLANESRNIGKLYGNKSFCMLIKADINIGTTSGELQTIYPIPSRVRRTTYFLTYKTYKKRGIIAKELNSKLKPSDLI
jgi:hypothetical protein